MSRRMITLLCVTAFLLTGVLGGCGPRHKFTRQRYETIYTGQEKDRVETTLGRPTTTSDGSIVYINTRPFFQAVISFDEDGKVTSKAWYNDRQTAPQPQEEGLEAGGTIVIDSSTSGGGAGD